jgi:CHAT domain-containing protein/lipopolysaccharide biosynthesis regulator YciM
MARLTPRSISRAKSIAQVHFFALGGAVVVQSWRQRSSAYHQATNNLSLGVGGLRMFQATLLWSLLFIAFGFAVAAQERSGASEVKAEDEAALRAVIEQYFALFAKEDSEGMMRLWSDKSPEYAERKDTLSQLLASENYTFSKLACSRFQVRGDKASLRISVDLMATRAQGAQSRQERMVRQVGFTLEGGKWKMWSYGSAADEIAKALVAAKSEEERQALLAAEQDLPMVNIIQGLFDQATRFRDKKEYEQALRAMEVARRLAEQVDNRPALAIALNNTAAFQIDSGNTAGAIESYRQSIKVGETLEVKSHYINALSNLGNLYEDLGNYTDAIKVHEQELAAAKASTDKIDIATALGDLGSDYKSLGNFDLALKHHREAFKIGEEVKSANITTRALGNMANICKLLGNYSEALELYFRVLRLTEEIQNQRWRRLTLSNIGEVYFEQGDYNLALDYYQKAGEREGSNNIANAYSKLGRYEEALQIHLANLKSAESRQNKRSQSISLFNIATLYREQERYAQALEYYQKSLEAEQGDDKLSIAQTLVDIGDLQVINGNHKAALASVERALKLVAQSNERETTWRAQAVLGLAQHRLGDSLKARQAFEASIATVESIRADVAGGEQAQQQFFEDKLSPYLGMVSLLVSQNLPLEALGYAERAKARVLLDVLSHGRADAPKAMAAQEIAREEELKRQLVTLNAQLSRESLLPMPDQKIVSELRAQLQIARLAHRDFEAKLFVAHPELRIKRGEVQPLTLQEANELLPDDKTVLLEFAAAEDKTFLFVLTKSAEAPQDTPDLKVFSIPIKTKDLGVRAQKFRQMLANPKQDLGFKQEAAALYDLLLKPAQARLQGKTSLVIVPDGTLWELPFQALLTNRNRFLIEDAAISYAPSLTYLREMSRKRPPRQTATENALLAVGNPALARETVARAQLATRGEKLEPLPLAEKEALTLAGLYGAKQSKVYVGAAALEERFKAEAGAYRVLHLATHGILDDRSPMYSHLLLSQAGGSEKEDGLLEAWEIMNLDLKADLAVLSACETARGRVGAGEGVIGLSWALFVAGVPTTVVSQWKVLDVSTQELMVEFHRQLKTKPAQGKAEALRQAALKVMKSQRHPFHWAGFILVGDGR